jgi:hypothetical protein
MQRLALGRLGNGAVDMHRLNLDLDRPVEDGW